MEDLREVVPEEIDMDELTEILKTLDEKELFSVLQYAKFLASKQQKNDF